MARIWEFMRKKLNIKNKQEKLNDLTKGSDDELYSPLESYEWVDSIKKRKEGIFDKEE